jgi:hydrogenase maturation protease
VKRALVLCLGNEILSDDAFGAVVAERLSEIDSLQPAAEVLFASTAGFNLLEFLRGRDRVLVVDTIVTGTVDPGTLHFFPAGTLTPSYNLINSHQMSLPTALELGKQLGLGMPSEIDVLAVEAQDVSTLREQLTPEIEASVDTAIARILGWIQRDD